MSGAPAPSLEEMIQSALDEGCRSIVLTRIGNHWQASVNVHALNNFRIDSGPDPIASLKIALGYRDVVLQERRDAEFAETDWPMVEQSVLSDIEDLL